MQEPGRPSKIHSLPAIRVQTTTEYVVHRTENGRGGTGTVQNLWNSCGVWQRQTLRRCLDRHQGGGRCQGTDAGDPNAVGEAGLAAWHGSRWGSGLSFC